MGGRFVRTMTAGTMAGIVWCTSLAASGSAQSVAMDASSADASKVAVVTLTVKDMKLERVLRMISQQAGLGFISSETIASQPKLVTMQVRDMMVSDAFAQALAGTGLKATIASGMVVFSTDRTAGTLMVQGGVMGRVIDAKTRQGLRDVTVSISGVNKRIMSNVDGKFRLSDITPGTYTVQARLLGYVKATTTVTVAEGQTASVEIVLEPSVNTLDQIVVTGTVVPTAQKAVPNAMTVVTAKELEQRGITRIEQLFRGDIPGLFVRNMQSDNALDAVTMYSRGATAITGASLGTKDNTNAIKTYVDGVELANPSYLSQIDPTSIERIEILTGPQASTIYGSNAINGVMQIFTKRGTSTRPQVTALFQSGWVENNFRATRTPQHEAQLQVNGTDGHVAYTAGGSWTYLGPWTPAKQTARLSGFGGARLQRGPVTVDGNIRLATTRNDSRGDADQRAAELKKIGWWNDSYFTGHLRAPTLATLGGQTLGVTMSYTPRSWWTHEGVLGQDRDMVETRTPDANYRLPSDTLRNLTQDGTVRTSWRYATTVHGQIASYLNATATIGGDGWKSMATSLSVSPTALTGSLNGSASVSRTPSRNAGGFLQTQIGLAEQLFLTYGLRAEWNPGFGRDAQPNLAPRYGASYARDLTTPLGVITTKVRVSYGRSTRPPNLTYKQQQRYSDIGRLADYGPYFGNAISRAENPDLGPEFQQGGEGGIEFYLGSRGSLVITRYNQTVDGLISNIVVDSVRSFAPGVPAGVYSSLDADGYGYRNISKFLNIGSIRNQGWEMQSTLNLGPLTTRGTYSWTKSRIIGITPLYRNLLFQPQYLPGASFVRLPEHTWALGFQYAQARTSIALNLTGSGQVPGTGNEVRYIVGSTIRLDANRARVDGSQPQTLNGMQTGYIMADLNVSHRFSSVVEALLQVQNLTDHYQSDYDVNYATLGRQTKFGFRVRTR